MDLNRILGAGSIPLLPGRGAFTQARDAWEFALSVSATEAQLWRAGFGDEPDEITTLAVERDPSRGEIRISVPRRLMRGDPARWGYVLLALTGDPARPGQRTAPGADRRPRRPGRAGARRRGPPQARRGPLSVTAG
jgi:hypothetical protein